MHRPCLHRQSGRLRHHCVRRPSSRRHSWFQRRFGTARLFSAEASSTGKTQGIGASVCDWRIVACPVDQLLSVDGGGSDRDLPGSGTREASRTVTLLRMIGQNTTVCTVGVLLSAGLSVVDRRAPSLPVCAENLREAKPDPQCVLPEFSVYLRYPRLPGDPACSSN